MQRRAVVAVAVVASVLATACRETIAPVPVGGQSATDETNTPPSLTWDGPITGEEGTGLLFHVHGRDAAGDVVDVSWDSDGDGVFESGCPDRGWNFSCGLLRSYADNGTYLHTIRAVDQAGAATTVTQSVQIVNVAPSIVEFSATPGTIVEPGTFVSVHVRWTDKGELNAPWLVRVDWRDGAIGATSAGDEFQGSVSFAHAFTTAGTYDLIATVRDKDGGETQSTLTITVEASAIDQLQALIDRVASLRAAGNLTSGEAGTLTNLLLSARSLIENGNASLACLKLDEFVVKTGGYLNRNRFPANLVSELTGAAQRIKTRLGC